MPNHIEDSPTGEGQNQALEDARAWRKGREAHPATEQQIAALEKYGVAPSTIANHAEQKPADQR